MTENEIQEQIAQSEQDAIALDFSKWSFEQRRANLPNDHNLWQQVRDRTLARQKSDNAEARRKYLTKLDDEQKARQAEADAQTETQLQPEKRRLEREWLVANPTQTAADFEKKAWHLLKENLIEQHNAASLEAEKQRQMETGRYLL